MLDCIVLIVVGIVIGVSLVRYGVGLGFKMRAADERGIPLDHVIKGESDDQEYTK